MKGGNFWANGSVTRSILFCGFHGTDHTKGSGVSSVVKLCLLLAESRSKSKTIILCSCGVVKALTWAIKNFLLNTSSIMQCRQLLACKARHIQLNAVVFHLRGINRACSVKLNRTYSSHPTTSWDFCLHHTEHDRTESPQTSVFQTTVLSMCSLSCTDWMQIMYPHTNSRTTIRPNVFK